jgi:hypothetical protein
VFKTFCLFVVSTVSVIDLRSAYPVDGTVDSRGPCTVRLMNLPVLFIMNNCSILIRIGSLKDRLFVRLL